MLDLDCLYLNGLPRTEDRTTHYNFILYQNWTKYKLKKTNQMFSRLLFPLSQ